MPAEANDAFRDLGSIVLGEQPLPALLDKVVHLAKQVLAPQTEASITLINGDDAATVGFTADLAVALDETQYESERGPCLDAAASGHLLMMSDVRTETRWPQFVKTAEERGVRSSLSIPLPVQNQLTGALNLYANEPDAFDDESIDLGETFAAHAAVAVSNAHLYESTVILADQMKQAMASRAVIEQAKGIIMRDRNCSADEAFDALVRLSQESHLKLRDVAQRLVDGVSSGGLLRPRRG